MNNESLLLNSFKEIGIVLSEKQVHRFLKYMELIKYWNSKTNITSIENDKDVILKHFLDSVVPCTIINFKGKKIIDIGTGAGFPGLPIKILLEEAVKINLLDSSKKKIAIVKEISRELDLIDIEYLNDNVENIGRKENYRGIFDIAVVRAVSSLNTVLEYSIPLLKIGGISILYKGPIVENEVENSLKSLTLLNGKIVKKHEFIVPFSNYSRNIVVVEKIAETDIKYPRRVGVPRKKPL
ncbi:MAG: 16S rRNA (guanine(527)-N(7))-methyltransferase RsmG [candidate division FCPU426 bacterium]